MLNFRYPEINSYRIMRRNLGEAQETNLIDTLEKYLEGTSLAQFSNAISLTVNTAFVTGKMEVVAFLNVYNSLVNFRVLQDEDFEENLGLLVSMDTLIKSYKKKGVLDGFSILPLHFLNVPKLQSSLKRYQRAYISILKHKGITFSLYKLPNSTSEVIIEEDIKFSTKCTVHFKNLEDLRILDL